METTRVLIAGLLLTSVDLEGPTVKDAGAVRVYDVVFAQIVYINSFEKSLGLVDAY